MYRRYGFHYTLLTLLVCSLLLASVSIAYAVSVGNQWFKNGVVMYANNTTLWVDPISKKMTSYSSATTTLDSIYVDDRLEDRCQNANGSWPAWSMYAYNNKNVANASTTGSVVAQGIYHTCSTSHDYQNSSYHSYYKPSLSINEGHFLYASNASNP